MPPSILLATNTIAAGKVQTSSLLSCPPIKILLSWICSAPNCVRVDRVATGLSHPLALCIVLAWRPWGPFLKHAMRSSYGAHWSNTNTCQCLNCEHAVKFNLSPLEQYNHLCFLHSLFVLKLFCLSPWPFGSWLTDPCSYTVHSQSRVAWTDGRVRSFPHSLLDWL